jgi:hypothetical protein
MCCHPSFRPIPVHWPPSQSRRATAPPTRLGDRAAAERRWPEYPVADVPPAPPASPEDSWDYVEYDSAGNVVAAGLLPGAEPLCIRLHAIAAEGLEAVEARSYDPRHGRWLLADPLLL